MSRSGFYKWRKRQNQPLTSKQLEDEFLKEWILELDQSFHHTLGYPRLTDEINAVYYKKINQKRVYRLQKELGIQAQIFKKKRTFIHEGHQAENILKRDFQADKPNQKWVTDITYLTTGLTRLYLSVILDLYSNEVVSYHIHEENNNHLVLRTINKALTHQNVSETIIHSDQGHQYTSKAYTNLLKEKGLVKSMSRKANCWDNAPIESFFGRLKEESMRIHRPKTKEEVHNVINAYMHHYNNRRRQRKLGRQSPIQYRKAQLLAA